jgi:GMP synthase (glutamine-hydrolysing)
MNKQEKKILLIHVREDGTIQDHEFELIVKYMQLQHHQVRRLDVLKEDLDTAILDEVDATIIGGSGQFLLSRGDIPEAIDSISQFAKEARQRLHPMLGICFGAQILSHVFGGEVIHDFANKETGTFEVFSSEQSKLCPIFSELPSRYYAQLGHQDAISRIPPGAILLGKSKRAPVQAWTFPNEPIYAVLFHPEFDAEASKYRLLYFADKYRLTKEEREDLVRDIKESPDAIRVLGLFLKNIVTDGRVFQRDKEFVCV